jgi:hypothetical protein
MEETDEKTAFGYHCANGRCGTIALFRGMYKKGNGGGCGRAKIGIDLVLGQ